MPENCQIPLEIQQLPPPLIALWESLPEFFSREVAAEKTGGLFTPRTLANLDSLKRGPAGRFRIGPKVAYVKTEFVIWLAGQIKPL